MTSAELVAACEALGTNDGKISTSIYRETRPKGGLGCPLPPEKPSTPLSKEELVPPTPTVYIRNSEEAFSPHLLDFCLKHPIVLVRNLAPACNLDLQLYTTKTLVQMHPNHPVSCTNCTRWSLPLEVNFRLGQDCLMIMYKQDRTVLSGTTLFSVW